MTDEERERFIREGLEQVRRYLREQGWTKRCGACPDHLMTIDRLPLDNLYRAFLGDP